MDSRRQEHLWKPETVRSTISDVARRAGVSTATVSRVMNRSGRVHPATAERVRSAVQALGYTPHLAARRLMQQRTNAIGLISAEIGGPYYAALLRGIEEVTARERCALLILSISSLNYEDMDMALPLGEHNTDGLLIFTNSLPDDIVTRLHLRGHPMVMLHRTPPSGVAIPHIHVANQSGAYAAVSHLLVAHERRRIVLLRGPDGNEDAFEREQGYHRAHFDCGVEVAPELLVQGDFSEEVAQASITELLRRGVVFDAIFAADDESAYGAVAALRAAGRRLPEDVAIVGFDDVPLSRHLTPALTTVAAPIQAIGRLATELLLDQIQQGTPERLEERKLVLETQLVVRRSCGCTASSSE
ncbi:MAG: LacI family transcriptional regulator [Caldilinea sp.]|nr:LacI family transcriptional regulator [Caldilinea sp.]MDW8441790.1 LacI family DNA-binding transcriptional regulator [Caldilineaceae bacterium]